jgi:hypothetical protein
VKEIHETSGEKNGDVAVTVELLIIPNKILNRSWFLYGALKNNFT